MARGFAALDPETLQKIARKGGKAAHAAGTAHQWTPQEASAAGKKGGKISRRKEPVYSGMSKSNGN